ncbi:MAG: hypothetical protein JNM10_01015 [Planctomycetia bacterium]|nr:hypothetical protein [Planctomycetia bacterium]
MRAPLAATALVAALAFGAWLLLRPSPGTVVAVREPAPATPAPARPADVPPSATPNLAATGVTPAPRATGPRVVGGVIKERGTVRVVLTLPAGVEPTVPLRIDVTSKGPALADYPLAVRQEDGTWLYESLPVGAYRLRVVADGLQATEADAVVRADAETPVPVTLVAGGAIAYRAVFLTGEVPEAVKLSLVDGRGVPVVSTIQVPAGMVHLGADVRALNLDLPAEARIVGLKPGAYRLRATAPSGEFDEQAVDVKLGEPVAVELKIRR